MSLLNVCLYVCSCIHGTAEPRDDMPEMPDSQTSQPTDLNETHSGQICQNLTRNQNPPDLTNEPSAGERLLQLEGPQGGVSVLGAGVVPEGAGPGGRRGEGGVGIQGPEANDQDQLQGRLQ